MSEQKLNQIETMLSDLILSIGTIKAVIEEMKDENQRRFEQIDKRFEQVDKRFDEVMYELRENKVEHQYMAARIFQNEMDIDKVKKIK
ncbi:hypothetical protein [Paenibacillus sp. J2TS4]|uniref:hypothetical protein n=1 Tax=Paenibacillus sp. J2TS4 TaxID=2807194 RepID=UPI001B1907D2|nr:hypothetical protein [Paenibacillus sp. J2TS4]GIP36540.1 hypothetical protein J2TS4_57500 [Paenibacillus sp. J2TS4]